MRMKRIAVILLILNSLHLSGQNTVDNIQQPKYGQLSVIGTKLTDDRGNNVTLRGVSYGWHNWHKRFYNEESVKWLKNDWHCSVVRTAMGVEPFGGYITNPDSSQALVESVIKGAIESGIYVIVDWHSHGIHTAEAKQFFGTMANKYANCPNIIWELYNEPITQPWHELKDYYTAVIDTIRTHDKKNVILIGCPHWNQDIDLVADSLKLDYGNIMYTMHFYAGTHHKELRDKCDTALSRGIPIFISECGSCEANGNGHIDVDEWNNWIDWCETNNISWVQWSISEKNETCSMLYPTASSTGNWLDTDLSESGKLTREKIQKLNY